MTVLAIAFSCIMIAFMASIPICWPVLIGTILLTVPYAYHIGSWWMFAFCVYMAACVYLSYEVRFGALKNKECGDA